MSFLLWGGAAAASAAEAVVRGLDHISVAVGNLEKAGADYEALGFVIKPGRAHANGIRNDRVKFADGTEVELITAARSADALSSDYLDWLKSGDGPAYLGLFAPSLETLSKTLAGHDLSIEQGEGVWTLRRQPALKRVFFARRQHSPTDRPEHFAHPNTAFTLSAGSPVRKRSAIWCACSAAFGYLARPAAILARPSRCSPCRRRCLCSCPPQRSWCPAEPLSG
jgi:hypothetical protein